MTGATAITLPVGLWDRGECHRRAVLRPLTGEDEEFLLEEGQALPPAQRTTALLARCVLRIGTVEPVKAETARTLAAGDREALLLHLHRLTFGDRIASVVRCPQGGCGERLDLELKVADLETAQEAPPAEFYERSFQNNEAAYLVRFRLPTGGDQEEAAGLVAADPRAAVRLILERCVSAAWKGSGPERAPVRDLPPGVTDRLSAAMAELDPQAELKLETACPACGHRFSAWFDTAGFLFQEVSMRLPLLHREVHLLAFHYHWSEAEILRMTPAKRRRYLGLLREALGGEENR